MVLAIATESSALAILVLRQKPESSNSSLIISATALILMILIWLPKRFLAKALDSSAMQGEATCSLSCIQVTFVLFIGSLLFKVWKGGWWVDGATSIALGLLFAWEGVKMMRWARSNEFTGGCCQGCQDRPSLAQAELAEVYRDMCDCCLEKEECRNSDECKCAGTTTQHQEQTMVMRMISSEHTLIQQLHILRIVAVLSLQRATNAVHAKSSRALASQDGFRLMMV